MHLDKIFAKARKKREQAKIEKETFQSAPKCDMATTFWNGWIIIKVGYEAVKTALLNLIQNQ